MKIKLNLPRVRIELTTFRLWDWRAAYCANEADAEEEVNPCNNASDWLMNMSNYVLMIVIGYLSF